MKKGSYVGIHSSGFRDFLLKPDLMRAVTDCGFEPPREVQHECIPQAVLGMDVICQARMIDKLYILVAMGGWRFFIFMMGAKRARKAAGALCWERRGTWRGPAPPARCCWRPQF